MLDVSLAGSMFVYVFVTDHFSDPDREISLTSVSVYLWTITFERNDLRSGH